MFLLTSLPDLACTLLFLAFWWCWLATVKAATLEYQQKHPSPSKFAVLVYGLPDDVSSTAVKQFFQQFGEVIEAQPCSGYTTALKHFSGLSEAATRIKRARCTIPILQARGESTLPLYEQTEQQLADLKDAIQEMKQFVKQQGADFTLKHYFVVFENTRDKAKAMHAYRRFTNFSCLEKTLCCCCIPEMPASLRFKGTPLALQACQLQPQSIIWQNQGI